MKLLGYSLLWLFLVAIVALTLFGSYAFLSGALDAINTGAIEVGVKRGRSWNSGYLWLQMFKFQEQPIYFTLHLGGYIAGFVGFLSASAMIAMMLLKFDLIRADKTLETTRLSQLLGILIKISGACWLCLFFGLRALFAIGILK